MAELPAKQTLPYMPQLDGVRAFAIIFVILSHWFAPFTSSGFIPYGELGVMIFFVLSGFLITSILLNYKSGIENKNGSTGFYLKKFFKRRVLRIFPIYYLTILLVLLIKPSIFEGGAWWHGLYLSNFYFVLVKHGWQQPVSQWWSLAVEEQFYLVWPFLILFINRKYLTFCIVAIIITGPAFRLIYMTHDHINRYLTPGCFDALGFGALLALHYTWFDKFFTPVKFAALFIIATIAIVAFTRYPLPISESTDRFFLSIFSLLLIYKASKGFKGVIGFILSNPVIIYIGKISYGLYLYHKLIPEFNLNIQSTAWLQCARIAILLLIASASYFLIEKPILSFKKYA